MLADTDHNNMARSDLLGEQTRRLYRAMPVMNVLEPACAAIIAWVYWDTPVSHLTLIAWAVLVAGIAFLRFVAGTLYRHLAPDMDGTRVWRWLAMLLTTAGAGCFAFAAIHFNPAETLFQPQLITQQAVFASLTAMMIMVAFSNYAIYLPRRPPT